MKDIKYINADNAATTKLNYKAYKAMEPYLLNEYGNPSAGYTFARKPRCAINESREIIASCINANPDEIIFTSGGTESDNWAIYNACWQMKKGIDFLVTSTIEHHAVLNACHMAEKRGYRIKYAKTTIDGLLDMKDYDEAINTPNCMFASIMMVNNEVGTIQDIRKLTEYAHYKGVAFHTDAVQAIGHIPVNVNELGVDLLSASAHKFNGPRGIGFLYVRRGISIVPFVTGGSQEKHLRAGTENVAGIVGMAVALKDNNDRLKATMKYETELRAYFLDKLNRTGLDYRINGTLDSSVPSIISISFKNADGEMIMHRMDLMNIAVSTGAACNSKENEISHVISAICVPDEYSKGTIRISLGKENLKEDVDRIVNALVTILNR